MVIHPNLLPPEFRIDVPDRPGRHGAGRGVALAVAVGVLLSGSSVPPDPVAPPYVRWTGGTTMGPSAVERGPWVGALRLAQVERVAAENSADFSSYRLRQTWPDDEVWRMVEESRRALRDGTAEVHVGPMPFIALDVEESDDGRRAVVRGCAARPARLQEKLTTDAQEWPTPATFTLETSDDGYRRVVDSTVGPLDEPFTLPAGAYFRDAEDLTPQMCDRIQGIPVGVVVPVPDLYALMEKEPEDVVPPIVPTWGDGPIRAPMRRIEAGAGCATDGGCG